MRFDIKLRGIVRFLLTVAIVASFGQILLGQSGSTPPKTTPPVPKESEIKFTSRTELVLVPVIVTAHGNHVPNLTKEDFTVFEDKKPQRIAVFEELRASSEKIQREKLPANTFSNYLGTDSRDQTSRRLVIIALDTINTRFTDQVYARQQMVKFLAENIDSGALISLVSITRGGIKVIHDFTTNPAVLIAALKKVKGTYSVAEGIASDAALSDGAADFNSQSDDQAFQNEVNNLNSFVSGADRSFAAGQQRMAVLGTLDCMQQLAHAYAGVPGRKALIWATAGFPFTLDGMSAMATGTFASEGYSDVKSDYERTWKILNDANFSVYPVDVRGLVNPSFISAATRVSPRNVGQLMNTQVAKHMDTISTMQTFAGMTGGRAFYNSNDLKSSFKAATNDSAAYYMVGYYLDRSNTKPGWRKLNVKVNHSHVEVRTRSGFFVTPTTLDPKLNRSDDISLALSSPMDFTAVPLVVRWTGVQPDSTRSEKKKVGFTIQIPPNSFTIDESDNNRMVVEFVGVAQTEAGVRADGFGKVVSGNLRPATLATIRRNGVRYTSQLDLVPGQYSVHFLVRDNLSGRMGTLTAPLKVE